MTTETVNIRFRDTDLSVEGSYKEGHPGSRTNPPDPEEFEVVKVLAGGVDISNLIDDDTLREIEREALYSQGR